MSDDPRKAKTLGEAALNADGKTYNGAKAIAWLSEVLHPGQGFSEEEAHKIFERAKAKRAVIAQQSVSASPSRKQ